MKPTAHLRDNSACLPRHPAVAYSFSLGLWHAREAQDVRHHRSRSAHWRCHIRVGWAFGRLNAFRSPSMPATSSESESFGGFSIRRDGGFSAARWREHDTRFLTRFGLSFASEFFGLTETPRFSSSFRSMVRVD